MIIRAKTSENDSDEDVVVMDTAEIKCSIPQCMESHSGKSNCTEGTCSLSYGRVRHMKFRKLDLED